MTATETITAADQDIIAATIKSLKIDDVVAVSWGSLKGESRTVRVTDVSEIDGSLYVATTSGRSIVRKGGMLCVRKDGRTYFSPTMAQGDKRIASIAVLGAAN